MKRIGIIGAGLSGLATAWRVQQQAAEQGFDIQLTVLEQGDRPGGSIWSARREGFLVEWGPNGFLNNEPATIRLVDDLGMRDSLLKSNDNARRRFILVGGKLREVPTGPAGFITTGIIGPLGKLRFAMEPFIGRGDGEDESVASFVRRRFGHQALERMFDPLMSGIYAGDVERLSVKSALSTFAELEEEYGSVVKGMIKRIRQRRKEKKENPEQESEITTTSKNPMLSTLYSFRNGMGELIARMAESLDGAVCCGHCVRRIESREDGWSVSGMKADGPYSLTFDRVVAAGPPVAMARALEASEGQLASELAAIEASPMTVVALGFRTGDLEHDLNGFGYLIPRREGLRSLGCLWSSSIFENRAEPGTALLTVMIGGAHDPQALNAPDELLVQTALDELRNHLGVHVAPFMTHVLRHGTGIPQYNVGHQARVARIESLLENTRGLFLAGNGYYGISANDCIKHSERLADHILQSL